MITKQAAQVIAHNWSGGQHSDFYAFASTGCVQSEEHRAGILAEAEDNRRGTEQCLKDNPSNLEYTLEPVRLEQFVEYIKAAPISEDYDNRTIHDDVWHQYSHHDSGLGLDEFATAYVTAALRLSTDDDDTYDETDVADDSLAKMKEDCAKFQAETKDLIDQAISLKPGYTMASAGQDFWLTRNGHGVGFWDRDLGEIGDALTKAADTYGEVDTYVGDDKKVHQG